MTALGLKRALRGVDSQDRLLRRPFRIANEEHFDVTTLTVTIESDAGIGHGECNPFSLSGWTKDRAVEEIRAIAALVEHGIDRVALLDAMSPGPARNAVDSALFDLECIETNVTAGEILGTDVTRPVVTALTAGLPSAGEVVDYGGFANLPMVKVKIDASSDTAAVCALREVAPLTRIIVDANGSLDAEAVNRWLPVLRECSVEVLEQPMAPGKDSYLRTVNRGDVAFCADESFRSIRDLAEAAQTYDMVNVKLDKVGGVTAAKQVIDLAPRMGLRVMVGCMMGTSLSAAPAWWLAQAAEVVDIDGPTLLAADVDQAMSWDAGLVSRPAPELWG